MYRTQPGEFDPVEREVVLPAQGLLGHLLGVLTHGTAIIESAGQEASRPRHHVVGQAPAGGVEGTDQRSRTGEQGRVVRPGRQRFVEMDDVEVLVAHGPNLPQLGRRIGSDRGDRAVGGGRQTVAERGDAGIGGWTIARGEHPDPLPLLAQRAGQAKNLHLHATGERQAVGQMIPIRMVLSLADRGPLRGPGGVRGPHDRAPHSRSANWD